ncbi:MAG TPA: hypothetical protein VLJ68_07260 [Chitinophagaceae bacterium]|nr:hypothetical protein [Chitinophagaceae bacterium]
MKKHLIFLLVLGLFSMTANSQLAVFKALGKNAKDYKLGIGGFAYWSIPLNEAGNNVLMLELVELGYFQVKDDVDREGKAYGSIKIGFKHIFSEEGSTGFYIEPAAGWGIVTGSDLPSERGLAIALEGGYSWELGSNGNNLNVGLKYEADLASPEQRIYAIGLKISYSFRLFGGR